MALGLVVMLIFLVLFLVFRGRSQENTVLLVREESYFSDFSISEETNQVDFICWLTFTNPHKQDVSFTLAADFCREQQVGLIVENDLTGENTETGEVIFNIAGESKASFWVRFVGTFGGNAQKSDRNLPDDIEAIPLGGKGT